MATRNDSRAIDHGFAAPVRPLRAMAAGARFLMNIDETHHFFTLTDAIDSAQNEKNYQRYLATPAGAGFEAEAVNFAALLCNSAYLENHAAGSLAARYVEFLDVENLDLETLLNAEAGGGESTFELDDRRRVYLATSIAIHDLLHVLTSYDRSPVGEACVLAFTAENLGFRGVGLIAHALAAREQAKQPRLPIFAMIGEARRAARQSVWLPTVDWRILLGLPLAEARAAIGLSAPEKYLHGADKMDWAVATQKKDAALVAAKNAA